MRINVQMLDLGATVNDFEVKSFVEIHQGETIDLFFQFIDKDKNNLRFIPASGATVLAEIARFPDVFATISNQRVEADFSIRRTAAQPFATDGSIWSIPITAAETDEMMSSNIRFTLTEGSNITKSLISQAIKVIPKEGAP